MAAAKRCTRAATAAARELTRLRQALQKDLLTVLRRQSRLIGYGFFRREAAPELYDLAMAAKDRRGRSVSFGGIVFPLSHGWSTYVLDPETGDVLVSASAL